MGKYDNCGLSPEEIKEMERLDAEELLLEKRQRINSLKESTSIFEKNVVIKAKKSKNGYQLLAILFGVFGIHDFYAGFNKLGLAYLISSVIFLFCIFLGLKIGLLLIFISWAIAILECIVSVKDSNGNRLE